MVIFRDFLQYSRNSANGHLSTTVTFSRPGGEKNPYIDSCLKPLYNGHFLLSPKWQLERGSTVYKQRTFTRSKTKNERKKPRLKYINHFLSLTLVITVKVHLLRDFTTETKRYLAPSKGAVL